MNSIHNIGEISHQPLKFQWPPHTMENPRGGGGGDFLPEGGGGLRELFAIAPTINSTKLYSLLLTVKNELAGGGGGRGGGGRRLHERVDLRLRWVSFSC